MTAFSSRIKNLSVITGMSGAGKSMALRTFEDLGYEVVDNPPLALIDVLLQDAEENIAVGIDIRSRGFSPAAFIEKIKLLKKTHEKTKINLLFIDCEDAIIRKRYTETRRKHPLTDGEMHLYEALEEERKLLSPIKEAADMVIDTSDITGHAFKRIIERRFSSPISQKMSIVTMSFAYKKGIPAEADLVFDVRFLRNPHYDENLRPMTGIDKEVRDYIKVDRDYEKFWSGLKEMLTIIIPRYIEEGKSYLTIAFGCTGGRHRSATFAEETKEFLETKGYKVDVIHREIEKELKMRR